MYDTNTQKISPFLWFDTQAEEAMDFYVSIFKNSKILFKNKKDDGTMFTGSCQLEGQTFMVLNGGPHYKITPAISFFVDCKDQAEVDELWDKLLAGGGEELQCGWLTDRFGVSWQIIPKALGELLGDPDKEKSARVMDAMMKMVKINVAELEKAAEAK